MSAVHAEVEPLFNVRSNNARLFEKEVRHLREQGYALATQEEKDGFYLAVLVRKK